MTLYMIIYLVGYVLTYYYHRYLIIEHSKKKWTYGQVITAMFISLLSWGWFFICLVVHATFLYDSDAKPPKWL